MARYYEVHEMYIERAAKLCYTYFQELKKVGFNHSDALQIIGMHGVFPKFSSTDHTKEDDI